MIMMEDEEEVKNILEVVYITSALKTCKHS